MPILLDANDPTQVASASHIEFQTGQPGQKSVILSGIAIPSWNIKDGDNLHQDTVTVNLRYPVLAVMQATITLGLASIYSGGTTFLYASDSATLCVDESSQELLLQVDVALMGDPAHLSRFGYQVVVVVTTQTTGIFGTIRFTTDFSIPPNSRRTKSAGFSWCQPIARPRWGAIWPDRLYPNCWRYDNRDDGC